ncbi:hypothetical protein STANM309S_02584 [Streptomyces tanashiensis]
MATPARTIAGSGAGGVAGARTAVGRRPSALPAWADTRGWGRTWSVPSTASRPSNRRFVEPQMGGARSCAGPPRGGHRGPPGDPPVRALSPSCSATPSAGTCRERGPGARSLALAGPGIGAPRPRPDCPARPPHPLTGASWRPPGDAGGRGADWHSGGLGVPRPPGPENYLCPRPECSRRVSCARLRAPPPRPWYPLTPHHRAFAHTLARHRRNVPGCAVFATGAAGRRGRTRAAGGVRRSSLLGRNRCAGRRTRCPRDPPRTAQPGRVPVIGDEGGPQAYRAAPPPGSSRGGLGTQAEMEPVLVCLGLGHLILKQALGREDDLRLPRPACPPDARAGLSHRSRLASS